MNKDTKILLAESKRIEQKLDDLVAQMHENDKIIDRNNPSAAQIEFIMKNEISPALTLLVESYAIMIRKVDLLIARKNKNAHTGFTN